MTEKELIRAEIERRFKACKTKNGFPAGTVCAIRIETYEGLLSFIDSLPEEKPSEDLEKAARLYAIPHYMKDIDVNYIEEYPYDSGLEAAFIAGSEWRYQKDRREFAKLKAKQWSDGYDEGIAKGKEQMMKDAVEGEIVKDITNKLAVTAKNINLKGFKFGDKVKIIIAKQ